MAPGPGSGLARALRNQQPPESTLLHLCSPCCPQGARPLAGWRGTGALGAACNCLCLKVWGVQARGAERQVRAKAESHESSSSPSPRLFPTLPTFFFRPCSDCYSVLTAGNGTTSRGSQPRHAGPGSRHPLGKGLLVWDHSRQAAPGNGWMCKPRWSGDLRRC